ncbi:MAG: hypothetical protein HOH73_01990 [Alphaproteobacteria bacterium]|jgi:type IV secretory pathway VirB6-like protein|nr:hypothetical protein [Alphaproteobacteria bacterium]
MLKKYLIILISLFFINSCDMSFRCIDAADFGQPGSSIPINGDNIEVINEIIHVTQSSYTGYVLNGDDLKIQIRGAWSTSANVGAGTCNTPNKVCSILDDFDLVANNYILKEPIECPDGGTSEHNICWFPYGMGIEVSFAVDRSEKEVSYSLIHPSFYKYDSNLDAWLFEMELADLETNIKAFLGADNWSSIKIYLKVIDDYYGDNVFGSIQRGINGKEISNPVDGQITISEDPMDLLFLQGARIEEAGFLEAAARAFTDPAEDLVKISYNAYIDSSIYNNIYQIALLFFVMFTALGYFLGFINLSIYSVFHLTFRFAIIVALLNPSGGWEFFDKYVVTLFWDGSYVLANIVLEAFSNAIENKDYISTTRLSYVDSSVLENVDNVVLMFFSEAIAYKIWGLLFSHQFGWLLILALYYAFWVFTFSMIKLTVIFIIITMLMTILLSMAPIFLIFSLFKYTRENYFEPWLKALIGAAIQPMMLFVFVGIFLTMVTHFMYEMLYYDVCWQTVVDLVIFSIEYFVIGDIYEFNSTNNTINSVSSLQIDLTQIFLLFLTALIIQYFVDEIPKIADKISDGVSLEGVARITNSVINTVQYTGEEFAKNKAKGTWKRTAGRGLSLGAEKMLPSFMSKAAHKWSGGLINKTKQAKFAKAEKKVTADLKAKGLNNKEIDKLKRSGKFKQEVKKALARDKAKDERYGNKSLNPLTVAKGEMRKAMDDFKVSLANAQRRSAGRRVMTKGQERKMRDSFISKDLSKHTSGDAGMKLDDKVDKLFDNKFTNQDLRQTVRGIKDSGDKFNNKDELHDKIRESMSAKGYSEEDTNRAIENDEKSSLSSNFAQSRIKAEFPNLKEGTGGTKTGDSEGEISDGFGSKADDDQAAHSSSPDSGGGIDPGGESDVNQVNTEGSPDQSAEGTYARVEEDD